MLEMVKFLFGTKVMINVTFCKFSVLFPLAFVLAVSVRLTHRVGLACYFRMLILRIFFQKSIFVLKK